MNLNYLKRSADKKSESKKIRREGKIPSIIYSRSKDSENIAVDSTEFGAMLRKVQPGRLCTTVFELAAEKGKALRAILKDIQYDPTTYRVVHLDFEELVDNLPVNVKVPIELVGVVDCIGVKLGGNLRQVIRFIRVRCLPKDIPTSFQVDVRAMGMGDSFRLKDIQIPQSVRPLADLNEVAVLVAKR